MNTPDGRKNGLNLVLLGGPGAGKGTQAETLKEERNLTHLSTGDILRSEVEKETDLGLEAKEYMDEGKLVPDELVLDMIEKRLQGNKDYLLDGFPRTIDQAKALQDLLELDLVIYIKISRQEAIRRLSSRRVCSNCGRIYNTIFNKPKSEGVCDSCGGDLYQREDDTPEVIRDRFETFLEETAPLVNYYENQGLLVEVDGEQKPSHVNEEIESALRQSND